MLGHEFIEQPSYQKDHYFILNLSFIEDIFLHLSTRYTRALHRIM